MQLYDFTMHKFFKLAELRFICTYVLYVQRHHKLCSFDFVIVINYDELVTHVQDYIEINPKRHYKSHFFVFLQVKNTPSTFIIKQLDSSSLQINHTLEEDLLTAAYIIQGLFLPNKFSLVDCIEVNLDQQTTAIPQFWGQLVKSNRYLIGLLLLELNYFNVHQKDGAEQKLDLLNRHIFSQSCCWSRAVTVPVTQVANSLALQPNRRSNISFLHLPTLQHPKREV